MAGRAVPSLGGSTYTAIGASNTCGHGLLRGDVPFQSLVYTSLRQQGAVVGFQPSCVAAMGPDYPASCLTYFAPNTTTYATIEFTPNMGSGDEIERSAAHLEYMATQMRLRPSRVVLISLVPRPPTCAECIRNFALSHAAVERVASRTRLPLVTMHYNESTWSDDLKHLNGEGHRQVTRRVLDAFREQRRAEGSRAVARRGARGEADPYARSGELLPRCVFGADLQSMVLPGSRGFSLMDSGRHRDKPGLLTSEPGSMLRLCLRGLPRTFGVSLALERSDILPTSNVSLSCETGCTCPLELLSNGDLTLRFVGQVGGVGGACGTYAARVMRMLARAETSLEWRAAPLTGTGHQYRHRCVPVHTHIPSHPLAGQTPSDRELHAPRLWGPSRGGI